MGASSSSPALEYSPVIQTKNGSIRGKVFNFDDKKYDAFLGIPFAQPPVGELRFKKPVPADPWPDTRDCIEFGPRCPQKNDFIDRKMNIVGIDEAGCLTLNVITPREPCQSTLSGYPVMVWIHGGGFAIHSSSNYGDATIARNLCSKGVIYVSINYRLGVFGFLSTGDEMCKGNMGLWDQTLALEWVKNNIQSFGGDPNNVTLFGQSAGGASVDLLSLSPHSRDLFKRVIPMSGNAECSTFAMRTNEAQGTVSKKFARLIGWKGEDSDSEDFLHFMSKQSSEILFPPMPPSKNPFYFKEPGCFAFQPNFDEDFFPSPISELRKAMPKKDVIIGATESEGLILSFATQIPFTVKGMRRAMDLTMKDSEFGTDLEKIKEEIVNFYIKDVDLKNKKEVMARHAEFLGDLVINNGTIQCAQKMAQLGHNVYFYNFEYHNPKNFGFLKWLLPYTACSHGSELRYLLGKGVIVKFRPNEDDLKMLETVTTYFTNFAKCGNPNGENTKGVWEKLNPADPYRHLKIQFPQPQMVDDFQGKRYEFWKSNVLPKNKAWSIVYTSV